MATIAEEVGTITTERLRLGTKSMEDARWEHAATFVLKPHVSVYRYVVSSLSEINDWMSSARVICILVQPLSVPSVIPSVFGLRLLVYQD
jgi:hypothetical protein